MKKKCIQCSKFFIPNRKNMKRCRNCIQSNKNKRWSGRRRAQGFHCRVCGKSWGYLKYCPKCRRKRRAVTEKKKYRTDRYHRQTLIKAARKYQLKIYGLTIYMRNKMLRKQNGVCYICKKPEIRKRKNVVTRLCVDHDHQTGKVRHLLCYSCNLVIGHIQRGRATLGNYIDYLIKNRKRWKSLERKPNGE